MNKFLTLIVLVTFFTGGYVQAQTCCTPGGFQLLALNKEFIAAHHDPLPLNYAPDKGSMISFETLDGTKGQAFYVPSDEPTTNVLLLFHEWWGLNDYIKREAERWQGLLGNIDVYAVDLYDGKVATTQATASKLSSTLDKKRAEHIIKGALAASGKDKRVATLGWCMGGTWSLAAAILAGERSAATVMYYGYPRATQEELRTLQSDILYIWASQDKFINRDVIEEFQNNVLDAGRAITIQTFNADHAFANPSNPKHDRVATAQAEALALSFLKEKMQLK